MIRLVFPVIRASVPNSRLLVSCCSMKLSAFLSIFPLFLGGILCGQENASSSAGSIIGRGALAAGLYEVAEFHFKKDLTNPVLEPSTKADIAIRLAETLIRSGDPVGARQLLDSSIVAKHPEIIFWKAQAFVAEKRFSDAAESFSALLLNPSATHRTEAGMTLASIQLALGNPESALATIGSLIPTSSAEDLPKLRLNQAEILLDLNRPSEARSAMPDRESLTPPDQRCADLLNAHLHLQEKEFSEAQQAFQALYSNPQHQSLNCYHLAAIGLADAIRSQGDAGSASELLLSFLRDHPHSPLLEAIIGRIIDWLPPKISPSDPILEQLAQWIPTPTVSTNEIIAHPLGKHDALTAWPPLPKPSAMDDLGIFSLYAHAVGLQRVGTPESRGAAKSAWNRLRIEFPAHPLAERSLYQLARVALDDGNQQQALAILATLRENAFLPFLRGESAFLEAKLAVLANDPRQAAALFEEAATELDARDSRAAKLRAAVLHLGNTKPTKGLTLIQQTDAKRDPQLEADLQLEQALSASPPGTARTQLDEFLNRHPRHSRAAEARLAALEAALTGPTPDLPYALSQLEILEKNSEISQSSAAPRIALARLRLADLTKDSAATQIAAQGIIDTFPTNPAAAEAALTLGRSHFQGGNYNSARLVLEKLAASDPDSSRAQVAWLLAARSAALGGTPQSKEEALILFDKAGDVQTPLTAIAILEKARHLIDMFRLDDASKLLTKWTAKLPPNDPLQIPAGLLLGEALYAQGSSNEASLIEALAVYDGLLVHTKDKPVLFNQLQYLRGRTLEELPDETNPTKKREKSAFLAYYSVLETTDQPAEWEFFESCGFRALSLLEKSERWLAAINVAQKIASFKGPRAEEAATRAKKLQLEIHDWED